MRFRQWAIGGFAAILSITMQAQIPQQPQRAAIPRPMLNFDAIPRPAVPPDPLELVTSPARPVQDAQDRIAAISALNRAHDLSNVRAQPYDLKTSFAGLGGLSSDGNWMLEDIAADHAYRWTAQGPNYSAINLYPSSTANGLYSNVPGGAIPLRLAQVRAAIFFTYPNVGPQASVRTAVGLLNGKEQHCLLIVIGAGPRSFTGPRNWEESEYCIDAKTGLLSTYSVAPGLFVQYDYSSGIQFHGKSIPASFKITEGGRTVIEAKTIAVTDPPAATGALFNPAGLVPIGVGRAMNPPINRRIPIPAFGQPTPVSADSAAIQIVALHATANPRGPMSDIEILASTDPSLNEKALQIASTMAFQNPAQPGATEQSQEQVLTLEFIVPAR